MAKTYEFEFDAAPEELFAETVNAVVALGFSIVRSEGAATSVTFNTGASIWSAAGQDLTATAVPQSRHASKLVVSGRTAARGNQAHYGSWGERGRIAKGLAARVRRALDEPVAGTEPPALVAELATLVELHRSGELTDVEFAGAKQRLLG